MSDERAKLTLEEAINMISKDEHIHTFRQAGPTTLIGADWDRKDILAVLEKYPPELSGAQATSMKHGLVLKDEVGYLFIQTIANKPPIPKAEGKEGT